MLMLKALTCVALAAAAATAGAVAPPAAARHTPLVRPVQPLAMLLGPHTVRAAPGGSSAPVRVVPASRPITGGQTVLPVIGRTTTSDGAQWLRVMLPGRPNASTGWIAQRGTVLSATVWHVLVSTSRRRVRVYRRGRLVRSFEAIVGKPSTPTPHGLFFVEESIRMTPGSAGAPFALALSARSDVLQEFEGGPGQIALHGLARVGGTLGTAASHGCVRLDEAGIRWMAARIAPGVPVTIRS
jgi:lipoprotein-anchoring transpeptidase ErfK/SrfK